MPMDEGFGRYGAIPANENHGWYVEDHWTGKTVCDFYFMKDGEVVHHEDAETYAKLVAKMLDARVDA